MVRLALALTLIPSPEGRGERVRIHISVEARRKNAPAFFALPPPVAVADARLGVHSFTTGEKQYALFGDRIRIV